MLFNFCTPSEGPLPAWLNPCLVGREKATLDRCQGGCDPKVVTNFVVGFLPDCSGNGHGPDLIYRGGGTHRRSCQVLDCPCTPLLPDSGRWSNHRSWQESRRPCGTSRRTAEMYVRTQRNRRGVPPPPVASPSRRTCRLTILRGESAGEEGSPFGGVVGQTPRIKTPP